MSCPDRLSCSSLFLRLAATSSYVFAATTVTAQVNKEEEFPPGLHAVYESGDRRVERIDPDIAFDWGTAAPDPQLAAGPFDATWTGQLLVRQRGRYRFHVYAQGKIEISVDGKRVVFGRRDHAGWLTGDDVDLTFGEKPLQVVYRRDPAHSGRVSLFWSAEHFPIEPVPAHLLFCDTSVPKLNSIERGRLAWESHRCDRCHRRSGENQSPAAPALTAIRGSIDPEWLIQNIRHPSTVSTHANMPSFRLSDVDARAVAAFLMSKSDEPILEHPDQTQNADTEGAAGRVLMHSVGCLACHSIGRLGSSGPFGGGDLSSIGRKRTIDWFYTWLADAKRLNRDHRMPTIRMSSSERRQLAMALSELRGDDNTEGANPKADVIDVHDENLVARGRRLVHQSRCAACHRINDVHANVAGLPTLGDHGIDWTKSCVSEPGKTRPGQPLYESVDPTDIRAFVESRTGELSPLSQADRGRQVLARRGCLACHERGRTKGIASIAGRIAKSVDELNGQSEALIPPALTAVGDKLIDTALTEAIRGDQTNRRLPWLHVRMPQFRHSQEDQQALLRHLISHDRIPAGTMQDNDTARTALSDDKSAVLVAGHTLVGARGLNCVACHKVGRFEPRNVVPGTRGSDLKALSARMRPQFYLRWTRSPLRIVPGMEMPSYLKAVPGVLNEEIDTQLMATWQALNDPRFTAPTDPGSVEQFFSVSAGSPTRIIRDVFTNSEGNGSDYTVRAFAVGMNNGHNVLFDLDTSSLRGWTFGDMARQRTQGKSWYWDMAGVPVMTGFDSQSDILLRQRNVPGAKLVAPKRQHGTGSRLVSYRNTGTGTELTYELNFELDSKQVRISVAETVRPLDSEDDVSGWERSLKLEQVPAEYDVLIEKLPPGTGSVGRPEIKSPDAAEQRALSGSENGTAHRGYFVWRGSADSPVRARVRYLARLTRQDTQLKTSQPPPGQIEAVTTVPGFDGVRLPVHTSIMPTAMTWTNDGRLAFTSLKGHVFIAHDTDGDGLQDQLSVFEEGLAAPYGIIADGADLIVAHKPELIRLSDTDGDGRADKRTIVASGWGYTDNYHDWTCGIVRDSHANLYISLGSDYAQENRPRDRARWRGTVLRIKPGGTVEVAGRSFRYPTGLAIDSQDRIFISDNQGVQNTFNEINFLRDGAHYGVPNRYEQNRTAKADWPAVQVPHPWSRSVNGLLILRNATTDPRLLGHGIGCEYDSRFLVRFTVQQVGDAVQGACYYFSRPHQTPGGDNFVGPLCGTVAPNGDIYIGSIHDSGWLGGLNTGAITRLRRNGRLPNGIRELRATHDGFEIKFLHAVNPLAAGDPARYTISGYTREWGGNYSTPDSGRHRVRVRSISVSEDARSVHLTVDRLQEQYVYEVTCNGLASDDQSLWPATGHYTMKRIPDR